MEDPTFAIGPDYGTNSVRALLVSRTDGVDTTVRDTVRAERGAS